MFETPLYDVVIQTDRYQASVSCDRSLSMSVGVSDIMEANCDMERMFVLVDQKCISLKDLQTKLARLKLKVFVRNIYNLDLYA